MELVARGVGADAGQALAVLRGWFAADGVTDAGLGHEIALVGAVGEDFGAPAFAVLGGDGEDARALAVNAVVLAQAGVEMDVDVGLGEHVVKDSRVHVRLGAPVGRLVKIVEAIVGRSAQVKVADIAADDAGVADVGGREPAGDHAAEMRARLQQNDAQTLARGCVGGHDAGGRAAVNDQVGGG